MQGVLAARIDRLADDRRRVLREASVIGREFLYELIKQISKISGSIGEALADLESVDLIREKNQSEYLEYIFKHALTQEVAYEGLLKKERRGLHLKVGQAIESLLQHRAGELVETLAYHYQRAFSTVSCSKANSVSRPTNFVRIVGVACGTGIVQ